MTARSRSIRIAVVVVLGVPAAIVLALLAGLVFLQSGAGERWLAGRIEGMLGTPEAPVRITGLALDWPLDLRIAEFSVADAQGTWLTARNAAVDWRPSRLLAGTFAADSVSAETVDVLRKPIPAETTGQTQDSGDLLPQLPVAVDIGRIAATLRVAEAVSGTPAELRVGGHARIGATSADVALDLDRTGDPDGGGGRVMVEYDRPAGRLAVDVDVGEPVGAVLTGLAAGAQLPPMALRITGAGPLSDWQGTVYATTDGEACIDAKLRLSGGQELGVAIEGEALPKCLPPQVGEALGVPSPQPPPAPERHGALLPGVRLAVAAQEAPTPAAEEQAPAAEGERRSLGEGAIRFRAEGVVGDDEIRVGEVQLDTPLGELSFSGTVTGEDLSGQFALGSADVTRLARQAGIEMTGEARLTGTVSGTRASPVIQAELQSPTGAAFGLAWRELQARIALRKQEAAQGGAWLVDATGRLATADGLPAPLAGPLNLALTAEVDQAQRVVRLGDLRVTSQDAGASVVGVLREWGEDAALHAVVRADEIAAYANGASGAATLRISVRGNLIEPALRASFAGYTRNFSVGIPSVDGVIGPAPRLSGAVVVRPDGLPLLQARVVGAAASLRATGSLGERMSLAWRLAVPDLAALRGQDLTGEAAAAGVAVGSLLDPKLLGLARILGSPPGLDRAGRVVASFSARDLAEAPQGTVVAQMQTKNLAADLATRYRVGEVIALEDLRITSNGDRIAGDLRIRPDGLLEGALQGRVGELRRWAELVGQPAAGTLAFEARLAAENGDQVVRADLSGSELRLAENRIGSLRGDLRLDDAFSAPTGTARLVAENALLGGVPLTRATLTAEGSNAQVAFGLDARGPGPQALLVDAAGRWRPQPQAQEIVLDRLRLVAGERSARLAEQLRLTVGADGIALAPAVFAVEGGRLSLAGSLRDGNIQASLDAERLPLQLAAPFLPARNPQGTISGEMRVTGTMERPQAVAQFTGRDVAFAATGPERMDVDLEARWQDGVLRLDLDGRGGAAGTSIALDASLPLVLRDGLTVPESGPLRASLAAEGSLERITDLLPLAGHRFAGTLRADLTVAGTVGRPLIEGEARLVNGFYQFFETGTVIRNLDARLVAQDSQTFELRMRGVDGQGGNVGALGTMRVLDTGLTYTVDFQMAEFQLVDVDAGTAQASGRMTLSGTGEGAQMTGRIDIGPAEYDIGVGLPGGSVPTIEVVEINKPGAPQYASLPDAAEPVDAAQPDVETAIPVALNIQTNVERLFVRGQGLDSIWAGRLMVEGTMSEPRVTGSIRAVRGFFDFVGRRFELAESQVVFDGGTTIDPRLDVLAEAQAQSITAQVRVTGPADAPQFAFTSNPPYPQDEILSRLLFGREMGQLSVAQQIQIARAAASLAGGNGGFDPIGSIRQGLGLDMLELGAGDLEEGGLSPSVAVGKYLDDDTFLRVEEGGREGGEVSIERQIGRGLSVEAEVGRRGGGGVGLNWRRDY